MRRVRPETGRPGANGHAEAAPRVVARGDGRPILSLGSRARDGAAGFRPIGLTFRRADVSGVTRHLATLLDAGFALDRALQMAGAWTRDSALAEALDDVRARVRQGSTLAAALARHPGFFDEFYRGVASAGERAGALAEAFDRLADDLEQREALRSRLLGALIYPAVMVGAGSLAVVLLLVWVIPRFATILGDLGGGLPWSARALLGIGTAVQHGWWLGLAATAACAVTVALHRRLPAGRLAQDRWLLRMPVVGPLRARLVTERLARALGGALAAGIPLLEALDIGAEAAVDAAFRVELRRAAESVRRGGSLAGSLDRGGLVPELVHRNKSSMTYSHAATSSVSPSRAQRFRRRPRS